MINVNKNKISARVNGLFCVVFVITFSFSCNQSKRETSESKKDSIYFGNPTGEIIIPDKAININSDTLLKLIFNYGESYYNINSIDSIITLHGKPNYLQKSQWGESSDSLITVGYPKFRFTFAGNSNSKYVLEGIDLFDKNISLAGRISIGNTTRNEVLQDLGLPDSDHNDLGRTITKSGSTTSYGTQSGAGDTVTFMYYLYPNNDEYSIGFSMTKDTVRKVSWDKNLL